MAELKGYRSLSAGPQLSATTLSQPKLQGSKPQNQQRDQAASWLAWAVAAELHAAAEPSTPSRAPSQRTRPSPPEQPPSPLQGVMPARLDWITDIAPSSGAFLESGQGSKGQHQGLI
eukprot:CAMPEP_0184289136 /NCGR_PEP_ID=MMETSP1049-20130417/1577_1 /TAXON_ID=77928 /ORGANISM="Proteomonas sulcata, Strain CCMP704" /LENGTH=116 /DNA_ID=CAMNT_0026595797 /DNA_START=105 /DNA_END=456 /DNA_ORIENTATION=+